jgi:hypothetical protein
VARRSTDGESDDRGDVLMDTIFDSGDQAIVNFIKDYTATFTSLQNLTRYRNSAIRMRENSGKWPMWEHAREMDRAVFELMLGLA